MVVNERLRLFCALRLPDQTVAGLAAWQERELQVSSASRGRIVPPGNLHVTLAFLGGRPADEIPAIADVLRGAAAHSGRLQLHVRGYRETQSVGMVTFDDEGGRAGALAERVQAGLEEVGVYRREARPWLPHVTVLRFRERPRLRPPLPELGEISPSDAAVYISRLRPDGAQYDVLESVALGG